MNGKTAVTILMAVVFVACLVSAGVNGLTSGITKSLLAVCAGIAGYRAILYKKDK